MALHKRAGARARAKAIVAASFRSNHKHYARVARPVSPQWRRAFDSSRRYMKNIATLRSKGTFFGIFAFLFWFSIPPTPAVAQGVQGQNRRWPTLYNA